MAPPMKKPVNQNDLRRLMKERRDGGKVDNIKIDSPLAKYDSNGNLSCSVCKVPIKNQGLWSAHLVSPVHRNSIENLKKPKHVVTPPVTQKRQIVHSNGPSKSYEPTEKKSKPDNQHSRVLPVASQKILAHDYSSSEESDSEVQQRLITTSQPSLPLSTSSQLPPGFFDEPQSNQKVQAKVQTGEKDETNNSSSTALPEGFFDDPILDAKIRKVEYKDPMDEEWEKFQKTITEENNVSQAIIEEDLVESTLDREIGEIDEQIQNWSRVDALLERKERISIKDPRGDESGNSSADEQGFEEFLDWRAKGAWKSLES